mgnify:FL=1
MIPSVEVYVSKAGCSAPAECDMHIGTCRFNLRRGAVSTSFSYSSAYLESPNAFAIDPALPLRSTSAHCDGLPGALRDSAPDRWGRHLIDRRALVEASEQHCRPRTLDEVDYLLGVYDASRQWSTCARRNGCKESEMTVMGRVIEERCDALDAAFA